VARAYHAAQLDDGSDFHVAGDVYPFGREVRVAWRDGTFGICLVEQNEEALAGDADDATVVEVLSRFLSMLIA
jgi:hypothetical protein